MSDEMTLRGKARDALVAGTVPHRLPDRMWGGSGGGAPCIVCGSPVAPHEVGLEIEYALAGEGGPRNHEVHLPCYSALEAECAPEAAPGISMDHRAGAAGMREGVLAGRS